MDDTLDVVLDYETAKQFACLVHFDGEISKDMLLHVAEAIVEAIQADDKKY